MQPSSSPTVVVRNLSKTYALTAQGSENALLKRRLTKVRALKPLSFVAYSGESIGILGRNGSGKSTMLRLIAGSESPTTGEVYVSERPTLLGVTAALQKNLSGLQNVRLGLLAMGLSPADVSSIEGDVLKWADLEDAKDRPLSTYSSGMSARLKFAISTAANVNILLVDEALSTGDSAFAAKAKKRMSDLLDSAGTVFLVSHAAQTIKDHCTRALWLNEGELITDGEAVAVVKGYRRWSRAVSAGEDKKAMEIIEYYRQKYEPVSVVLESEASRFFD